MQSPKESHMSVLGLMYIEPTIRNTLKLMKFFSLEVCMKPPV